MNWLQKIYDYKGNIIFDPTSYGDNIVVDTSNNRIRYYDKNGNLLFDSANWDDKIYNTNHELLFSNQKSSINSNLSSNKTAPNEISNKYSKPTNSVATNNISETAKPKTNITTHNTTITTNNNTINTIKLDKEIGNNTKSEVHNSEIIKTTNTLNNDNIGKPTIVHPTHNISNGNITLNNTDVANKLSNMFNCQYRQEGNLITSDNKWQIYVQKGNEGAIAVDNNTTLVAYYHRTGEIYLPNELKASFENSNSNTICVAPCNDNYSNQYFTGENNICDAYGVAPQNVTFVGASRGCSFLMNDFADYIIEHPEAKHQKCLLIEGNKPFADSFTETRANAISDNGAMIFVVAHNDEFHNNIGNVYGTNSDARVFSIILDFQQNISENNIHMPTINNALASELGLVELLSGDNRAFLNMIEKLNSDGVITATSLKIANPYIPKFKLRYHDQVIELTAKEFYDYYTALDTFNKTTNLTDKMNTLMHIYKVEGTISNVPPIVTEYMTKIRSTLNSVNTTVSMGGYNDMLGLGAIINATVSAYNECMSSFKNSLNNCTNLGSKISKSYVSTDKELANNASEVL